MRPLVIRFGAMGDIVLLTGLLRMLHRRYGAPCDLLSSGGWTRPLLAGNPDIADILLLRSRRRPYWTDPAQWALVRALRKRPPGPVYVCDAHAQDKLRALLARAGIDGSRCVFYDDSRFPEPEHWFDRWRRYADFTPPAFAGTPPVSDDAAPSHPLLFVGDAARRDLAQWRDANGLHGPLVLLQPGNKRTLKRGRLGGVGDHKWWPVERWAGLARGVLDGRPDAHVLLCGAPPEQPLLLQIAERAGDLRVRACGEELPMARLLALCEAAHSLVSIDTGPAHAAVALGCPAVVMYGASAPNHWLPRGPAGTAVTALGGAPEGLDRVEAIALERVLAGWRALPPRSARRHLPA